MARGAVDDPIKVFRYRVRIDGFVRAGFTAVTGFKRTTDEAGYREGGLSKLIAPNEWAQQACRGIRKSCRRGSERPCEFLRSRPCPRPSSPHAAFAERVFITGKGGAGNSHKITGPSGNTGHSR